MHPITYELAELLELAAPYVASAVDVVDGPYGEPMANPAMILAGRITEALADFDRRADQEVIECDLAADTAPIVSTPVCVTRWPLWN